MKRNQNQFIFYLVVVILFLMTCTKNPFFKDDEIVGKNVIKGSVALSDGVNADNVLIWFEQNGLTARTDSTGEFELQLPPPSSQGGEGWTGEFTCYFYLAGYLPDSIQVWVREGDVQWEKGDIGKKGEIKQPVILNKNLETSVRIEPNTLFADFVGEAQGAVTFRALDERVVLKVPFMFRTTTITRYILQESMESDGYPKFIFLPNLLGNSENYYLLNPGESLTLEMPISWPPVAGREFWDYPPGDYILIPYFWVEPENLPAEMQLEIESYYQFDEIYMDYPFHHPMGHFTVSQDSMLQEL